MAKNKADIVKNSDAFTKAKHTAETYAKDPTKLNKLIDKAIKKATAKKSIFDSIWAQLTASFRLIKAYASGTYREIPWSSLIMIVASIIYFVMPTDLIPDFIFGLGLIDDAALLGWVMRSFSADIDKFIAWEKESIN